MTKPQKDQMGSSVLEFQTTSGLRARALEVSKIMGANLKNQRLRLGLSQTQLGELVDVTFQQIQKYEAGKNAISSAMLYDFSLHLNVPVSNFYQGLELRNNNSQQMTSFPSLHYKEIHKILEAFSSIKYKKLRQSLINTITAIGEQDKND